MPYKLQHSTDGYYVINSETGRKHSQHGLSKRMAERQMRALYAAEADPPKKSDDGRPKKFIQEVVSSPKFAKGAFTAQALQKGMKPLEFMKEVLESPEEYSMTTRRRAQFLKNIQ